MCEAAVLNEARSKRGKSESEAAMGRIAVLQALARWLSSQSARSEVSPQKSAPLHSTLFGERRDHRLPPRNPPAPTERSVYGVHTARLLHLVCMAECCRGLAAVETADAVLSTCVHNARFA